MLIPYCHQVPLDFVGVEVELREPSVHFSRKSRRVWKTGVEMEALVAASTAALTLYDMLKAIDDTMEIGSISLLKKEGGKSDFPKEAGSQVRAGVLVLSDLASKGQRQDLSGIAIKERLEAMRIAVVDYMILPDDQKIIEEHLVRLCEKLALDIVLTTGGTGLGPRDVTSEATRNIIQRELPGVEEFLRSHGQERTRYAMLGRGVAGVRGKTVIVNLPGSVGGVNDSLDILFPWLLHSLEMIKGGGH